MKNDNKLLVLAVGAALAACGGPDKAKPELAKDLSRTLDAVETTGGRWSEVRVLDSAHPYASVAAETVEVRGSAAAAEMRVVLERFELEAGYDFVYVAGAAGDPQRFTGAATGQELLLAGNLVQVRFQSDYSVTKWGYRIRVYERVGCACPRHYSPVCGTDDVTYGNECEAGCAAARVAYRGACQADAWFSVSRSIASPHPYANDTDQTFEIREAGATSIRVHFTEVDLERGYDNLRILDARDQVVATYTGKQADFHSAVVLGDTLKIQLTSDYSVTGWGFAVDYYQVVGGCTQDSDCGANQVCAQIECIRAPCFNVCEAAPSTGYVDVTTEQLEADPAAFDGQRVRLTAEPIVRPLCTRRACSQADPCCNVCSGGFRVGQGVSLRDATDQAYGCRGDECGWQSTCREFAPEYAGPYTFEGTFRVDQTGGASLLVDAFEAADCQRAGCSSQACANSPNVITTCDLRPEYACYANTACEPQATGHCGYTQTPELAMCLAGASAQAFYASDVPLGVPDDDANGVTSSLPVLGQGTVAGLSLSLEIRHTYRGDLVVTLISPRGTQVKLHDGEGGSADDLVILDRAITELDGEGKSGTWRLKVQDRYAQDVGSLEGWSLTFR